MAKTGDVMFTIGNTNYDYMLETDNGGNKMWSIEQLAYQTPSLVKNKIDMTIVASDSMRQADGTVISNRNVSTILGELRNVVDQTSTFNVNGYDDEVYECLADRRSTRIQTRVDESGRQTWYPVTISLWNLYT